MNSSIKPFPMREYDALTIPSIRWINDPRKNPKWFTAVSLFAGCGGSSTGIKLAGGDVRYISEFIPGALRTYRANATSSTYCDGRDIREVDAREIAKIVGLRPGELDYLDGSPPCKMFSSASRHGQIGKRSDAPVMYSENVWQRVDDLFDHHIRILKYLQPKITSIENVMGLAQSVSHGVFVEICNKIRAAGYELQVRAIDPTRLGVPQTRVRLVFLAIRRDLYKRGLHHVWPRPQRKPVLGVRDVVPDAVRISKGKGDWVDARLPSPTLTVTAGHCNPYAVLSAAPLYMNERDEIIQYDIPQMKLLFGFPRDFVIGGTSFTQRYERLSRSHAPLAVYQISGTMMRALYNFENPRTMRKPVMLKGLELLLLVLASLVPFAAAIQLRHRVREVTAILLGFSAACFGAFVTILALLYILGT